MTNTKTKTSPAKAIAAVVIAVILAFTLVCLLTGNINPVCRVTAMLMPVWLAAVRTRKDGAKNTTNSELFSRKNPVFVTLS